MATLAKKALVHIIYYSTYGHVKSLVDATAKGLVSAGVDVKISRARETLPDDLLKKIGAYDLPHSKDVPVVDPSTWYQADGFIFGSPTRFGTMTSQLKAFWDGTGGQWAAGVAIGKPAGFLTSTGTQSGGHETTALTSLPNMVHHGMLFVPHGYTQKVQSDNSFVHGISPWNVSTIAGPDGARKPLAEELEAAEAYGKRFGGIVIALKAGAAAAAEAAAAKGPATKLA